MPARKMIWDNESESGDEVRPSDDEAETATSGQTVEIVQSVVSDSVTVKIDDGRNKISAGLPDWTLVPPSIPIKRLVRKR